MNQAIRMSTLPRKVSLARALSKLGVTSRSKAVDEISKGAVAVNGKQELDPGHWVDLAKDVISFKGDVVHARAPKYLVINKPPGIVVTSSDERARQTIYDFVGTKTEGLFPVGRLDKDSTGLLLMTNDHRLGEFLTNPKSGIEKTYLVRVGWPLEKKDLHRLSAGIEIHLEGKPYKTKPAKCRMIDPTTVELTIHEGKNRQIRKMLEAVGYNVISLRRISLGPLRLGSLKEGKSRPLSRDEVVELQGLMMRMMKKRSTSRIGS